MFRKLIAAGAALTLAGLAGQAHAASHNRDTFIREQDRNADGKVSKDEFSAGRAQEFARMDANHDGGLTREEYVEDFKTRLAAKLPTLPAERREEQRVREMRQVEVRFGILDSDKSGKITPPEFDHSGWMMFARHDTNKDGAVGADDPIPKDDD
ncbi:hypothetical protein LJR225_000450 [Phenylobacterium sp. LjRoot225]|uniref:EF-hand domain-containing protein n=1 Tax=Phenylobacterium sp. LjRoot225 TaxID=3342285 RepID=UPI003ED15C7E